MGIKMIKGYVFTFFKRMFSRIHANFLIHSPTRWFLQDAIPPLFRPCADFSLFQHDSWFNTNTLRSLPFEHLDPTRSKDATIRQLSGLFCLRRQSLRRLSGDQRLCTCGVLHGSGNARLNHRDDRDCGHFSRGEKLEKTLLNTWNTAWNAGSWSFCFLSRQFSLKFIHPVVQSSWTPPSFSPL